MQSIEQESIDTLRFLSADAVERAGSGHPGMPMGAAPMAYVLWHRFLKHNPKNPDWPDRDRFILSAGHGSALLYSLLHLTGYDLPLAELERLRQWGSRTPGHPERHKAPGVEVTTGPLGQGFGMAVGMALAERYLASQFNTDRHELVDHRTYVIASDGDLMEGISYEASSLAGRLALGKLVVFYDENRITIDGSADITFCDDITGRFEAQRWHVQEVEDANDVDALTRATEEAIAETSRPSLIRVHSHIGYGSPKQDTAKAHGEPLGEEALNEAKENLGWPTGERFRIPDRVRQHFEEAVARGGEAEAAWRSRFEDYRRAEPERAAEFERRVEDRRPDGWSAELPTFAPEDGPMATRVASHKAMNALKARLPEFLGGSGDLATSNKTGLEACEAFDVDRAGCLVHYGVREHAMGAATNGMAAHGGVRPFAATFLIFSDYMRPAIRIAALMEVPSVFVFTHDSIGLGGDGPTHQPVEHLISLRAMPNLRVLRPADANETAVAWEMALSHSGPTALVLTRQDVPVLPLARDGQPGVDAQGVRRGAYVLAGVGESEPDVLLLATGSEVHLALEAYHQLRHEDIHARVVSMPSWEVFEEQPSEYRDMVLPPSVRARMAVEAAAPHGWERWVGEQGLIMGVRGFGASAPGEEVMSRYGFTAELVVDVARTVVRNATSHAMR